MFTPPPAASVYIAVGNTDMRKSINGLTALVVHQLDLKPLDPALFAFCNRRRDIIKILYWDRNGFCLWHKRLEQDRFRWPESDEEVLHIQGRELSWLLDGLHLEQHSAYQTLSYEYVL